MKAFILVGHGELPKAMIHSVKMMTGDIPNIYFICLMPEEGTDQLKIKMKKLETELVLYKEILVFADLFGGTPANTLFQEYQKDSRFSFITGMNFPMILMAVLTPNASKEEIILVGQTGIKDLQAKEQVKDLENKNSEIVITKKEMKAKQSTIHVRIDSRGIHGQVTTAWLPYLQVNRIVVIDDLAINNPTQKIALKMACPEQVKLSILSTDTAVKRLQDDVTYKNENILVLILRVETLKEIDKKDFIFKEINLGNVPARKNTRKYRQTIHLTDKEREVIKKIVTKGTKFTAQMVPNDAIVDFDEYLD